MSAPRVSVIVPFLDPPEGFLEEAVASVKAQTFNDWELLLVNDGSGSEARAIAEAFATADPRRIRCLQHDGGVNKGIPATRNLGLAHACGEFIAYLDSDDVWYPHKLSDQVRIMEDHPHEDMIFGRSVYWYSWGYGRANESSRDRPPPLGVPDREVLARSEFLRNILLARVQVPCPSNILVRAAAARAVGGFQENISNLYEDQAFYAKISLAGTVLPCADVWDRYRIHPTSVCYTASRQQAIAARREYLEWLRGYLDDIGHVDNRLRSLVRLEIGATRIPGGPRLLQIIRKIAARQRRWLKGRSVSPAAPSEGLS